tara:strand:+ start:68 stop:211 length:144 start_codon:yes stop_codon:yes gene_type:complete
MGMSKKRENAAGKMQADWHDGQVSCMAHSPQRNDWRGCTRPSVVRVK